MKSTPILYSRPMVIAHKEGHKTQTRRLRGLDVLNDSPDMFDYAGCNASNDHMFYDKSARLVRFVKSPYGGEGDELWIRETWCRPSGCVPFAHPAYNVPVMYAADDGKEVFTVGRNWRQVNHEYKWRPSIHMPRWACRFTARIISVRPERLHDMTESDAQAEGVDGSYTNLGNGDFDVWMPKDEFRTLWDSLNGDRYPWASNPWVWRIEYERNEVKS